MTNLHSLDRSLEQGDWNAVFEALSMSPEPLLEIHRRVVAHAEARKAPVELRAKGRGIEDTLRSELRQKNREALSVNREAKDIGSEPLGQRDTLHEIRDAQQRAELRHKDGAR